MSLDLVGAFVLTAISAHCHWLAGALVRPRTRRRGAACRAHFVVRCGRGACRKRRLTWGLELGAPLLGLSIVTPIVVLVVLATVVPTTSRALASIPLPALISVHAIRIVGFLFLLLLAAGRISAPFASSAGWGDIIAGATAVPVAWALSTRGAGIRWLVLLWNSVGLLDLLAALTLGHDLGPRLAAAAVFRSAGLHGDGHAAMGAHPGIPRAAADRQPFGDLSAAGPVGGPSCQHRFDIEDPRFGVI